MPKKFFQILFMIMACFMAVNSSSLADITWTITVKNSSYLPLKLQTICVSVRLRDGHFTTFVPDKSSLGISTCARAGREVILPEGKYTKTVTLPDKSLHTTLQRFEASQFQEKGFIPTVRVVLKGWWVKDKEEPGTLMSVGDDFVADLRGNTAEDLFRDLQKTNHDINVTVSPREEGAGDPAGSA